MIDHLTIYRTGFWRGKVEIVKIVKIVSIALLAVRLRWSFGASVSLRRRVKLFLFPQLPQLSELSELSGVMVLRC